ncbi:MAG: dynamin family protein [Desulfobacterales bacterium]|nr:dynamin family protein [Desulfobacterales bacterium]
MHRENYIETLRAELLDLVEEHLTPVALRYGYSEVPLESNIKWRPLVLVLGNYSSGKSTLINDFLGTKIQATGQAPTDDSFTVITHGTSDSDDNDDIRVVEERDGKFLLNDPEYPFETLKRYGQRFIAHFRLKKVNSPFLENLAIIDTPGMLDSITERDRGYDYQEIIGDLAQMADLVLVLFDPHKAGTVRETHTSLRDTLPAKTFEDRVLFVLNRIDECASLIDLLQVYGTLCWNLSQMTGRKDIPPIRLTYSPHVLQSPAGELGADQRYLHYLDNQRLEVKEAVLQAPRFRLDNLATFVETHGERLSHLLEALVNYSQGSRRFFWRHVLINLAVSLLIGGGAVAGVITAGLIGPEPYLMAAVGGAAGGLFFILWYLTGMRWLRRRFYRDQMRHLDRLTPLRNQTRRDSWQAVRDLVYLTLKRTEGRIALKEVKAEYEAVHRIFTEGSKDIREALNELATLDAGEAPDWARDDATASPRDFPYSELAHQD